MMKRIVRLGVAISLCATSAMVQAQSPWGRADREWNGSFLSSDRYYTARRMQDTPQAPEVDSESLPSPSDAVQGSGVQPQSVPPAASDAGNQASSYPEYFGSEPRSSYGDGLYGSSGEPSCVTESCVDGTCMAPSPCACCPWYGGIYGLAMTRSDSCATYLSYETAMPSMPVLTTNSADTDWGAGVETRIGYYLSDCWGIEAGYWGFYPDNQTQNVYAQDYAGDLASAIGYTGLSYNNGMVANDLSYWYGTPGNQAQMHSLTRSFQAHNFELNLVRNPYRRCGCVHFELLAGVRYLRLDDGMTFSTDYTSTMYGDDPNNEIHHNIDIQNDLIGLQIGGRADRYFWCDCLGLHVGSKLGIYNNHITHNQRICGGNGNAYVTANPSEDYYIDTSDDDIAFVGELFAGVSYNVCSCWRLTGGYRAVGVSGVGLATSQIPRDREFASISRVSQTNSCDWLLLHGAYFGVEYNW